MTKLIPASTSSKRLHFFPSMCWVRQQTQLENVHFPKRASKLVIAKIKTNLNNCRIQAVNPPSTLSGSKPEHITLSNKTQRALQRVSDFFILFARLGIQKEQRTYQGQPEFSSGAIGRNIQGTIIIISGD